MNNGEEMKFLKLISLFFFLLMTKMAVAGNEGGGGKSVVCRDAQGKITRAEILDLFEGRNQYQLTYSETELSWQEQVFNFFKSSGIATDNEIFKNFQNIIMHLNILSEEVVLKETNDSFEVVSPKGCKIEQVAIYINDNQILISGEIWKALSETQKAALIIHESVYRYLRDYGETNSKRARHLTAHLLSGKKIEVVKSDPAEVKAVCFDTENWNNTSFYVFPSVINEQGDRIAKVQFENIGARKVLSKSEAYVLLTSTDRELFEELVYADKEFFINPLSSVRSSFEPGDKLSIFGELDETGKMQLYVRGYSAINNNWFSHSIKCGITQ
jgi:hypothetical protein